MRPVQVFARVIVMQDSLALPPEKRWISPSGGGVAGGEKFTFGKVRKRCALHPSRTHLTALRATLQVFYKFARRQKLYPSDAAAHKAAMLEIVAMNTVVASNVQQLHIALTALYLIRGHCVIATARVPLSAGGNAGAPSLIYGSPNAGADDRIVELGARCPEAIPVIRSVTTAAWIIGTAAALADNRCRAVHSLRAASAWQITPSRGRRTSQSLCRCPSIPRSTSAPTGACTWCVLRWPARAAALICNHSWTWRV
jgi:hypothetical protein